MITIESMSGSKLGLFDLTIRRESGRKQEITFSYPDAITLFLGLREHFKIIGINPDKEFNRIIREGKRGCTVR